VIGCADLTARTGKWVNTRQPYTADPTPVKRKESTMQENGNTDDQNQQIDHEDWELAFEPYEGHPSAALRLGFFCCARLVIA